MEPPSLMELAGRVVKVRGFAYRPVVPATVADYLESAHECVNPKCKGTPSQLRPPTLSVPPFLI